MPTKPITATYAAIVTKMTRHGTGARVTLELSHELNEQLGSMGTVDLLAHSEEQIRRFPFNQLLHLQVQLVEVP
jgi:hypothetical protein